MRNSSYNLIPILLKLCRHCDHALNICMWLGYTPQINFCHFFYNLNLVIFWTFLHLESGLPVLYFILFFILFNIPFQDDFNHIETPTCRRRGRAGSG